MALVPPPIAMGKFSYTFCYELCEALHMHKPSVISWYFTYEKQRLLKVLSQQVKELWNETQVCP